MAVAAESAPNFEQSTPVCVHLKNIIDLALGTPDVGVVNFNLIHSIFHVIVSKLKLENVKVEIRGEEAAALRCLIESGQVSPSVQVSEYVIEKEDKALKTKTSETVTVVEKTADGADGTKRLSVATSSQYNILEQKVSTLEQKMTDATQRNSEILTKTKGGSKSVSEMWQMMNLVARMDAAENGVSKMSSLVEDLAMEINKIAGRLGYSGLQLGDFVAKDKDGMEGEDVKDDSFGVGEESESGQGSDLKKSRSVMGMIDDLLGDMGILKEEVKNLNENFEGFKSGGFEGDGGCMANDEKFCEINQAIVRIDNAFNSQMNYYQDKLTDLENEVLNMMQCMQETRALSGQVATLEEYSAKLQSMLEDIQTISSKTNLLMEEKEETAKEIELIHEELECLKHYKADIRDVEEALDEKADIKVVNKKVSVEQFSCAFRNVCESLNELYTKMTNQEITWRNALDDILRDLEKKIERNEAISMHEELYEKVKKLHERLKILENAKKEAEAAGSKAKYLRNVNCISCDNKVVMQKNEAGSSTFKAWPNKGNAVPYVCFDADFLKKAGKKICSCGRDGCGGNQECNRYCGGSHTKITQEQRLKQKGNIVNQYNMIEVLPSEPQETVIKPKPPATQDQGVMANLAADAGIEILKPPKKFFDCSDYVFGDVGQEKPTRKRLSPRDECGDKKGTGKRPSTERAPSSHSITSKRRSISKSHESARGAEKQGSRQSLGSKSKRGSTDKVSAKSGSIKKSSSEQGVSEKAPSKQGSGEKVSSKSLEKVASKEPSEAKVGSKPPSAEKVAEDAGGEAPAPEAAEPAPEGEAPAPAEDSPPAEEAPAESAPE